MHMVHDALRAVSPAAIKEIAAILELHPSEVADTMSFYGFFRDPERPLGRTAFGFAAAFRACCAAARSCSLICLIA